MAAKEQPRDEPNSVWLERAPKKKRIVFGLEVSEPNTSASVPNSNSNSSASAKSQVAALVVGQHFLLIGHHALHCLAECFSPLLLLGRSLKIFARNKNNHNNNNSREMRLLLISAPLQITITIARFKWPAAWIETQTERVAQLLKCAERLKLCKVRLTVASKQKQKTRETDPNKANACPKEATSWTYSLACV